MPLGICPLSDWVLEPAYLLRSFRFDQCCTEGLPRRQVFQLWQPGSGGHRRREPSFKQPPPYDWQDLRRSIRLALRLNETVPAYACALFATLFPIGCHKVSRDA